MAESGKDPHGEVAFLERLADRRQVHLDPVLDAGCGTGRVAIELARRGYHVEGTDIDPGMIAEARRKGPEIEWHRANLATLALRRTFTTVVATGNVILFVDPVDRQDAVAGLARHVAPGGLLVAGFQLQRADRLRVTITEWNEWTETAGLIERERYSTWDDDPFLSVASSEAGSDYIVTVHQQHEKH